MNKRQENIESIALYLDVMKTQLEWVKTGIEEEKQATHTIGMESMYANIYSENTVGKAAAKAISYEQRAYDMLCDSASYIDKAIGYLNDAKKEAENYD